MLKEFVKIVGLGIGSVVCAFIGGFIYDAVSDINNTLSRALREVLRAFSVVLGIIAIGLAMSFVVSLGSFIIGLF